MNKQEFQEFPSMESEASKEMHRAFLNSLKAINEYFDSPYAAKQNLSQDLRVANNVVNAFARIRQSESGREMVIVSVGKAMCESKKEFASFVGDRLPHLAVTKGLGPKR